MHRTEKIWILAILGLVAGIALVALVALAFKPHTYAGTVIQSNQPAFDFELVGPGNQPVHLSDYRGKVVLIFFGYTSCPDVCPSTMKELAGVLKSMGKDADKVQPLMITVDPERDTLERLTAFLALYDARILGLTGSLEQINAVAKKYGAFFEKKPFGTEGGYLVDHTAVILLVDPQGSLREVFSYGTPAREITPDIRYILSR